MTRELGRAKALGAIAGNRWLAHSVLFPDRHGLDSAPIHQAIVADIYSPKPRLVIEGFRGMGKTTFLEEAAIVRGAFRLYRNMLILGASYERACERLAAIKSQIDNNGLIHSVFGNLHGPVWQEGRIVLANGACLQALGRDQKMVGTKYLDWRPDAALVDDVEDPEEVRLDAERAETWQWFIRTFLPSLDDPLETWVRVLGTRRGSGSLPERLEKSGWPVSKYPAEYAGGNGERIAAWPAKLSLDKIDELQRTIYRGDPHTFAQEYLCRASSEGDRVFRREMFRVEPRERSWQAVYAMIDPARTTNRQSATTGWAVWSWVSNRLVVWDAGGEFLKPDEIVELVFRIAAQYEPVFIGVEEDGLNEFILQPLRHEQVRRATAVPTRAIRAPKGKLDFIRGLQHFFNSGEVVFACALPELEAQLLSFPSGRIDAPNALAYALTLRPGAPVYDGFGDGNVAAVLEPSGHQPLYLAVNATGSITAAVLCQYFDGRLYIFRDWVREGDASSTVADIYAEASLEGDFSEEVQRPVGTLAEALKGPGLRSYMRRVPPRFVVPPQHRDRFMNVGLIQAIGRIPAQVATGAAPAGGREWLRNALGRLTRGMPQVQVCSAARWTLNAFAGGYAVPLLRGQRAGELGAEAEEGVYRVLMEGLESVVGLMQAAPAEEEEFAGNWAFDRQGRRYRSAMPSR